MATSAFTGATQQPHGEFDLVLGKMLRDFDEISSDDYNLVGQVQMRTIVLAELASTGTEEQRATIIKKFGGHDRQSGEPTGKLDMNSAIFRLQKDTAVAELDAFIEGLNIAPDKLEAMNEQAFEAVHREEGVRPDAAASGVILKALVLHEYDRGAKQNIVDASLVMQMATRALKRMDAMEKGEYDRQAALDLANTHDKMSYKFDPPAVRRTNEALRFICATEQCVDSALQDAAEAEAEGALSTQHQLYESALAFHTKAIVDSLPEAARMYREAGKEALAQRAEEVHEHFNQKYAQITQLNIMGTPPKPEPEPEA